MSDSIEPEYVADIVVERQFNLDVLKESVGQVDVVLGATGDDTEAIESKLEAEATMCGLVFDQRSAAQSRAAIWRSRAHLRT